MRSRLLLSVAPLPTIRETSEEMLPGAPGRDPPASPSLDDYVRSICQLAQPASVLEEAAASARPHRPHRPARAYRKNSLTESLQDITARLTLPGAGTADPLDWLFGGSQDKPPSKKALSRRTGPSAEPRGSCRQMDSSEAQGAPRGSLCEARVPGHSLRRRLAQCLARQWTPARDAPDWQGEGTVRAAAWGTCVSLQRPGLGAGSVLGREVSRSSYLVPELSHPCITHRPHIPPSGSRCQCCALAQSNAAPAAEGFQESALGVRSAPPFALPWPIAPPVCLSSPTPGSPLASDWPMAPPRPARPAAGVGKVGLLEVLKVAGKIGA
ncbi:Protein DEPP1 [Galemys pyrenaicus]|uniref:Protein DEPP1 n=1 Tax=Galemys pyrenaicus TaxID=202257 RepID=A0A8J6AML1_GALPY|nr:Protein DEPP1 [Galemys pyrenaicus]